MIRALKSAWTYEIRLWAALLRWTFRRPHRLAPGTVPFPYAGAVTMLLWVFIGVSAVEIPILHLILPWTTARIVALVLGGYGLFWMIGLLATLRVHPHLVGPDGLRIRNGGTLDVRLDWDAIASVAVRRRSLPPGGQTQVEDAGGQRVLSLGAGSQTSVDVRLNRPLTVPVRKAGGEPVTQIRFHADDPEALVAAARERLGAVAGDRG